MKNKILLGAAAVLAIGCLVAVALRNSSPAADQNGPEEADGGMHPAAATTNLAATPATSAPERIEAAAAAPLPATQPDTRSNRAQSADLAPAAPSMKINGYELQDPLARVALSLVGADPDAEVYWMGAVNDAALPAEERKDLIEDLNEDGLSDPRHPTAEDLPLIISRIRLIERLAPSAMDEVNRDAFAEAYKDLVGLLHGQPPP